MSKLQIRKHGIDRFLPPEAEVEARPQEAPDSEAAAPKLPEPLSHEKSQPGPQPRTTRKRRTGKRSRASLPAETTPDGPKRMITIWLGPDEDARLRKEQERRIGVGGPRRGRTEYSTLIREAISRAFPWD